MNRIDSVSLEIFPDQYTFKPDHNYFIPEHKIVETTGEQLTSYKLLKDQRKVGIGGLRISGSKAVLDISAKILLDNYPQGITVDTIEQALKTVEIPEVFTFNNYQDLVQNSIVKRVDVCTDFNADSTTLVNALYYLRSINPKYHVKKYTRGNDIAISFNKEAKTVNEYFKFYDKRLELLRSDNAEFLRSLEDAEALLNHFSGKVRAETRTTSFKEMYKRFDIPQGKNTLENVLNSNSDVNTNIFTKISKPMQNMKEDVATLFDNASTFNDVLWNAFTEYIGTRTEYDYESVIALARHHFSGGKRSNAKLESRIRKEFISRAMKEKRFDLDTDLESFVKDIQYKLKAS
jgi:hypothetical protein